MEFTHESTEGDASKNSCILASNKWGEEYNPFIKLVLTLLLFLVTAFRPRKEGDLKIIWPIIPLLLLRQSRSLSDQSRSALRLTSKSEMLIVMMRE